MELLLSDVMTPQGIGRVIIQHPKGILGKDGDGPTLKVLFTNRVTGKKEIWFHENEVKKI